MAAITRLNTLFVSEDWIRIYEALQNVDFRAYDFDNLVNALVNYIQVNYPDSFNDWIASSEFIMKVEILAWLSQNIAFRVDLNARENFMATAERRESLLKLAYLIAYKVNRVTGASGEVKINSVSTTQAVFDSDGINVQNKEIFWNSPSNDNWFEQYILVLNAAFQARCPFGTPVAQSSTFGTAEQYRLNSNAPSSGVYPFSAAVNGSTLPFEIYNAALSETDGSYSELAPDPRNTFSVFYKSDGTGFGSPNTGFFLPIKQGALTFKDVAFDSPQILQSYIINSQNVSNTDFFVQQVDGSGNVIKNWTMVDAAFGGSTAFNTLPSSMNTIYEVDTLADDRVAVRFGDGKLGRIPVGNFRLWYRTVSPDAPAIKPDAITQKTITIPYVANNAIYYLTVKYSLLSEIINAGPSETNQSIRTRANKVFYTQNRMVNGEDLNNFFLRDSSIKKVKTVNRTYAGHSRFSKLTDPTGLYSNVKVVGDDGRLYMSSTQVVNLYSADPSVLAPAELLNSYIKPILEKEDKRILYFNAYSEIYLPTGVTWAQTSIVGPHSRGNVKLNGSIIPVGLQATVGTPYYYIQPGTVIRYGSLRGDVVGIERVVNNGTASDGVICYSVFPDQSTLVSVMPTIRTVLTRSEQTSVLQALLQKVSFALSWNQTTLSYQIIAYQNIDTTSPFSTIYQGDTSGTAKDASWMVRCAFIPGGANPDQWEITDRGLGYFFESARDVAFYFSNQGNVVDPDTGAVAHDTVTVLGANESRDSLRRRSLDTFVAGTCATAIIRYIGDGHTILFNTSESPMDPTKTIVELDGQLQVYGIDWTVVRNAAGDRVSFVTPPGVNADIEVQIASDLVYGTLVNDVFHGTGTKNSYSLPNVNRASATNSFVFIDGVFQVSWSDYSINTNNIRGTIQFNGNLPSGTEAYIYAINGINSVSYVKNTYLGDGTTRSFDLLTTKQSSDTVFVVIDGVIQNTQQYTITAHTSSSDQITFNTAPPLNTKIVLLANDSPFYTRTRNYTYSGDGITQAFAMTGLKGITDPQVIVAINGVFQAGASGSLPQYALVIGGTTVQFFSAPPAGTKITIYVIEAAIGTIAASLGAQQQVASLSTADVSSCLVSYVGNDQDFRVSDVLRNADGYTSSTGVAISPADTFQSGLYANPYQFRDLVLTDGYTDLVLWRQISYFGASRWQAITPNTAPAGTYSLSAFGGPTVGSAIAPSVSGDIHYDVTLGQWLIANGTTGLWVLAPDQTIYRSAIGRDLLKFIWTHYASDSHRIDPSPTNIHNTFILPSTYYDAYNAWVLNNGLPADEPTPPTPETLALQFSDFDQYKMLSDSIIYYPARFKPLFGSRADPSVQGTFLVIKSPGSTVSDNDLKIAILSTIDAYFNPDNFDFGETFYLTDLITYIQTQLVPNVLSIVIVPKNNNQTFGRLFQIQSESDELFISVATVSDIMLVEAYTDAQLRIGSF